MSWIDSCASLSASRGGRCPVIAAGFDEIAFVAPLRLGEHAVIDSKVTRSWGTSLEARMRTRLTAPLSCCSRAMQVMVRVLAEDPLSSARRVACTALVTYVSADRRQLPFVAPGACGLPAQQQVVLVTIDTRACAAESNEECAQWLDAGLRRRHRLEGGENNRVLLETDPLHTYPPRPPQK